MVVDVATRLAVLYVYLLPVRSASRDNVSHISSVVREVYTLQSHGAVGAESVGVEPYALLACVGSGAVHLVEYALVLQSVVAVYIPFALALERNANLLVVGSLLQSFQDVLAHGDVVEIFACHGILGVHPFGSLCAHVVLEPAVGVSHFLAEVHVNSVVLMSLRIGYLRHCVNRRQHSCSCNR